MKYSSLFRGYETGNGMVQHSDFVRRVRKMAVSARQRGAHYALGREDDVNSYITNDAAPDLGWPVKRHPIQLAKNTQEPGRAGVSGSYGTGGLLVA